MLAEIIDAVVVVDRAVLVHGVIGAQAVLDDEQRLVITVLHIDERIGEAVRIDLPAPIGNGQVGVLHARREVAANFLALLGIDGVDH